MVEITRADEELHIVGKSLADVFRNSAVALTELMVDRKTLRSKKKFYLTLRGSSEDDLLFGFLEEIILLKDSEQLLFKNFDCKIKRVGSYFRLFCNASGEVINDGLDLRTDVKGITLHEFELVKKRGCWEATVVVDV